MSKIPTAEEAEIKTIYSGIGSCQEINKQSILDLVTHPNLEIKMSNIQQLIVLDKTILENEILELKKSQIGLSPNLDTTEYYDIEAKLRIYQELLQQSKPLEPIVSDAFDTGLKTYAKNEDKLHRLHYDEVDEMDKQEYLTKNF